MLLGFVVDNTLSARMCCLKSSFAISRSVGVDIAGYVGQPRRTGFMGEQLGARLFCLLIDLAVGAVDGNDDDFFVFFNLVCLFWCYPKAK
jgi:hypothetical protein